MDSAFDFDNLTSSTAAEKNSNAMLKFNSFSYITKVLRMIELCVVLVFLSWGFTRLPFAVRISGEYFRLLVSVVVSPTFVFVLSNLIVLTLLFKGGHLSVNSPITATAAASDTDVDLYEDFIENSATCSGFRQASVSYPPDDEVVCVDKQTIIEEINVISNAEENGGGNDIKSSEEKCVVKSYKRSKSENLEVGKSREYEEKNNDRKLRRSETEIKRGRVENSGEVPAVDELSNEEFQKAIEEFIAKQIKFHKEEKLAIVLHHHHPTTDTSHAAIATTT